MRPTGSRWSTARSTSPTRMRWCASTIATARPQASGPPVKVTDLPSAINHHWTKALTASPDGRFLYVGIGSNSNITERGMEAEVDRAMVWQIDAQTGAHRPLRHRPAQPHRARHPARHGPALGGGERARRNRPEPRSRLPDLGARRRLLRLALQLLGPERRHARRSRRIRRRSPRRSAPDYSLGSHVAALGLAFSTPAMGARFRRRRVRRRARQLEPQRSRSATRWSSCRSATAGPPATPVDFVTGFLGEDGKTRGRPVGVTVDPRGALIVADDLSNTVWRVTPSIEHENHDKGRPSD